MAPHSDEQSSILTSSGRYDPALAPVRAISRVLSCACALVSATILGLQALPAAAAGLEPAKVNAEGARKLNLELIRVPAD